MSTPLPFPAAEFLSSSGVRVAILRGDWEAISALVLISAASWTQPQNRGSFPDDPERIGATIGMSMEAVGKALVTWEKEGWVKREEGVVWVPWVTKAAAEEEATAASRTAVAQQANRVRWSKPDSRRNPSGMPVEESDWPSDAVARGIDVWCSRFGKGSAPNGEIAGHFHWLKRQGAQWEDVLSSFTQYLRIVDAKYASVGAWRKRYAEFLPGAEGFSQNERELVHSVTRQLERGDFEPPTQGSLLDPDDDPPPKAVAMRRRAR